MTDTNTNRRWLGVFFIAIYAAYYVAGSHALEGLLRYSSYAAEVLFILMSMVLFGSRPRLDFKPIQNRLLTTLLLLSFVVAGTLIYGATFPLSVRVPFDLTATSTRVLLLLVAPLLEESIFRMALWDASRQIKPAQAFTPWIITSALFGAAHGVAYFYVPHEIQSFVIYQFIYTLALGFILGWLRLRTNSLTAPVLAHFLFNLGFLIAGTAYAPAINS